uniref:Uncharacterized protein n=1 Tax=Anguilla anguilla TaxID=7936 RepID=A0A0E9WQV9_ANGAN
MLVIFTWLQSKFPILNYLPFFLRGEIDNQGLLVILFLCNMQQNMWNTVTNWSGVTVDF